jgi:glutamate 5-kinase
MKRIPYLHHINQQTFQLVLPKTDVFSTGGMETKLLAAQNANRIGALTVIASGLEKNIIQKVVAGEDVGTLIGHPESKSQIKDKRKQWIAFFHKPQGVLMVNECTLPILLHQGKSLLPVGITHVQGEFPVGALVEIKDPQGAVIAKGFTQYDSDDLTKIQGKKTTEIADILGHKDYDEVIHRDNLVLITEDE